MARKKLRNIRPKAFLGIGETGALVALTAAEVAGHAGQAAAQYASAKTQGDTMLKQAQMQADALQRQNENNNQLQTQMMQFTKEQNEESRRIMKDMQMNLQLQAGGQSMRDRREASKTVLKNGGRKRRKLSNPFLRGSNFKVSDGGIAIPDITPQGYPMYDFVGDEHSEYHKDPKHPNSNDKLSGIGLVFSDGEKIEVENGEKGIPTPNDFLVLSNQTFIEPSSGLPFNPSKAVDYGMDPMQAHATQEFIKDYYGLSDDGSNTSPVKRRLRSGGGCILPIRRRASNGTRKEIASINNRKKASLGSWLNSGSWTVAPTISGIGNFLGAGLSSLGIELGSNYLSKRVGQAGDLLANAYGQLKGVNMSDVFGDNAKANFNIGHYMPALRTSYFNANPQLAQVNRDARRQTRAINSNTLSSAARLSRTNLANVTADDARSKIYADKANREEQIKQANNQAINEAAAQNAQLDIEMNKNYAATRADLAKFNANVANEGILGAAEARANALTSTGQIRANASQSIGNAIGSAISQTGLGFANALYNRDVRRDNMTIAKLAATDSGLVNYYGDRNTPLSEAQDYFNSLIEAANGARTNSARDTYLGLARRLASLRGFDWNLAWGILNKNRINTNPTLPSIATPSITINPNNLPRLN